MTPTKHDADWKNRRKDSYRYNDEKIQVIQILSKVYTSHLKFSPDKRPVMIYVEGGGGGKKGGSRLFQIGKRGAQLFFINTWKGGHHF